MALQITEELLGKLGFVQQNPPYIWDYSLYGIHGYFRFQGVGDQWSFTFNKSNPIHATDLMAVILHVIRLSHLKGVEETQNKFQEALGLDRLLDKFAELVRD